MNAHALLQSQGWRGHGHSLHKTDDSIGLSKPLLLNRKSNTHGLGTANAHFNNDQWWLNAFDEQLKGLETGKKGQLKQTVTTGKLNNVKMGAVGKYSVYTNFVSGGLLNGTIGLLQGSDTTSASTSDDSSDSKKKTKPKDSRKGKETKEERRARREARRIRKEARSVRRAARQEKRDAKAKRRAARDGKTSKSSSSSGSSSALDDEKRLRRAKKEEKRRKRKAG